MIDLSKLFNALPPPTSLEGQGVVLSAVQIPDFGPTRLAKDISGYPVILLGAEQSGYQLAPIILENLTVHHSQICRIVQADTSVQTGTYTTISCTAKEPALRSYFLHVVAMLLESKQHSPTAFDVAEAVRVLVELFAALARPSTETVQGLWAELFLIARAPKPIIVAEAWHRVPEAKHDFTYGSQAIEVKSTSTGTRQHYFSLEQLQAVNECDEIIIASMFVRRSEAGASLKRLIDELEKRLVGRPDLRLHINNMVVKTLGSTWANVLNEGFDDKLARTSLQFFTASSIPSVNPALPTGVTNVRFVSDLTNIVPVQVNDFRLKEGLFRAAIR